MESRFISRSDGKAGSGWSNARTVQRQISLEGIFMQENESIKSVNGLGEAWVALSRAVLRRCSTMAIPRATLFETRDSRHLFLLFLRRRPRPREPAIRLTLRLRLLRHPQLPVHLRQHEMHRRISGCKCYRLLQFRARQRMLIQMFVRCPQRTVHAKVFGRQLGRFY